MKNDQPMSVDSQLDLLKKIARKEPSPYLYTKIEAALIDNKQIHFNKTWSIVSLATACIFIGLHLAFIFSSYSAYRQQQSETENYLISSINSSYYE
jgi:hypothetical protein